MKPEKLTSAMYWKTLRREETGARNWKRSCWNQKTKSKTSCPSIHREQN